MTKMKKANPYPIGFIYPNEEEIPILLLFVAGKTSKSIEKWGDREIEKSVIEFLSRFVDPK